MVSILFGLIMGIAHYFSWQFPLKKRPYYAQILSLSAGISVAYIFLDLLPRFTEEAIQINRLLFISILLGFILFHIVEKYIYQHVPKNKIRRELAVEDSITSFIYHVIIGIILAVFVQQSVVQGTLFFIPVLLFTVMSTLPVDAPKHKSMQFILSLSTLVGVLLARFIYTDISPLIFYSLLGFIIGVLLYSVIRHAIPFGKEGKPIFFIAGVIVYTLLIIATGSL